jgi:hypothetical protein
MSRHQVVAQLKLFLQNHALGFRVLDSKPQILALSIRDLELTAGTEKLVVPVYDEFRDALIENSALRLHLILQTCEYYEESADYNAWLLDIGIHHCAAAAEVYARIENLVPKLRSILGHEIRAVPDWDIEFNTDVAQALRALE